VAKDAKAKKQTNMRKMFGKKIKKKVHGEHRGPGEAGPSLDMLTE
jgi:hypothetical protein